MPAIPITPLALAFLSGQLGIPGGGTYYNIPSRRNINTGWACRPGKPCRSLLLPKIGRELLESDPPVKFLFADGSNFVSQAPDSMTTQRAVEKIDFKVVVDAFMTDTAALADVVLPCALDHEREEIVGSCLHSQIPEERQQGLPRVWINSKSPVMTRLDLSKPIFLSTSLGRMPVELLFSDDLHPLSLIIRRGGWIKHGRCVNPLVEPMISDMGETAAYYSQYARLEN